MPSFEVSSTAVAPHVGAWIETRGTTRCDTHRYVAPHVGAWIETRIPWPKNLADDVAPHVGAWIETCKLTYNCS